MNLLTWKKYRITKSANQFWPWKIQERYTLFFFIKWWNSPSFAPPHLFKTKEEAFAYLVNKFDDDVVIIEKEEDET